MRNLNRVIAAGALLFALGGCAAYSDGYYYSGSYNSGSYYNDGRPYYRDGRIGSDYDRYRDRDRDGTPNRYDDYPRDPRFD